MAAPENRRPGNAVVCHGLRDEEVEVRSLRMRLFPCEHEYMQSVYIYIS